MTQPEEQTWNIHVKSLSQNDSAITIQASPSVTLDEFASLIIDQHPPNPDLTKNLMRLIYRGRVIFNGSGGANNTNNNQHQQQLYNNKLCDIQGMEDGQTIHLAPRLARNNGSNNSNTEEQTSRRNAHSETSFGIFETSGAGSLEQDALLQMLLNSDSNGNGGMGMLGMLLGSAILSSNSSGGGGSGNNPSVQVIRSNGTALNGRNVNVAVAGVSNVDEDDDDSGVDEGRLRLGVSAVRRNSATLDESPEDGDWRRRSVRIPSTSTSNPPVTFTDDPSEPIRQNLLTLHGLIAHYNSLSTRNHEAHDDVVDDLDPQIEARDVTGGAWSHRLDLSTEPVLLSSSSLSTRQQEAPRNPYTNNNMARLAPTSTTRNNATRVDADRSNVNRTENNIQISDNNGTSRPRWYVGQWVDVRDTVNQWLEASILEICSPRDILESNVNNISNAESDANDDTNAPDSITIRQLSNPRTHPISPPSSIRSSSAFRSTNTVPLVLGTNLSERRLLLLPNEEDLNGNDIDDVQILLIHYNGWSGSEWNEWIRGDSDRIRPFRSLSIPTYDYERNNRDDYLSPTIQSRPEYNENSVDVGLSNVRLVSEVVRVLDGVNGVMQRSLPNSSFDGHGNNGNLPWSESNSSSTAEASLVRMAPLLDRLGRALVDVAPLILNSTNSTISSEGNEEEQSRNIAPLFSNDVELDSRTNVDRDRDEFSGGIVNVARTTGGLMRNRSRSRIHGAEIHVQIGTASAPTTSRFSITPIQNQSTQNISQTTSNESTPSDTGETVTASVIPATEWSDGNELYQDNFADPLPRLNEHEEEGEQETEIFNNQERSGSLLIHDDSEEEAQGDEDVNNGSVNSLPPLIDHSSEHDSNFSGESIPPLQIRNDSSESESDDYELGEESEESFDSNLNESISSNRHHRSNDNDLLSVNSMNTDDLPSLE